LEDAENVWSVGYSSTEVTMPNAGWHSVAKRKSSCV
jgi:hypothetical protein